MTNIVNLDRDMRWMDYAAGVVPATGTFATASLGTSFASPVGQIHSVVRSTVVALTAAAQPAVMSFGCLILPPPEGDAVPYRIKGSIISPNACFWGFGYQALSDARQPRIVGVGPNIDEVVCIRPLVPGDFDFGSALVFFGGSFRDVVGTFSGSLSVQRLIAKPDQYASAVS